MPTNRTALSRGRSTEDHADASRTSYQVRYIATESEVDLKVKHVIVVQTKAANLGMNLLGQTLFSKLLVYRNFEPAHVDAVALCKGDDDVLHELALTFRDVQVVIAPTHLAS
jgi:hypothetical protein